MEQKLAEFRARRKAEGSARRMEAAADQRDRTPPAAGTGVRPHTAKEAATEALDHSQQLSNKASSCLTSDDTEVVDRTDWLLDSALGRWLTSRRLAFTNLTLLKVLLWLVLLGLFVELDFGLPFFLISLFYWLYEGLRSPSARKPGELSAYSVFNPNCQPLLGALTAEQLEGEMGYRPLANR